MTVVAAAGGITDLFAHAYLRHAFLAGTPVALAAGLVGYFLVVRAQVFALDALGHVAFAGAVGALAYGADPRLGLYVAAVTVAVGLAGLGRGVDDVAIGSTFSWVLGLGVFFLAVYRTAGGTGEQGIGYLFGSVFGLSAGAATVAAVVGAAVTVSVLAMARPLLFASVDPAVAAARGVPVRALGIAFAVLVGLTAAESTQAVGGLLVLGLVSAPAGAARRLTARPYLAMGLSAGIAVAGMWLGLLVAYLAPRLPPSFAVLAVVTAGYLVAGAATAGRGRAGPSPHHARRGRPGHGGGETPRTLHG